MPTHAVKGREPEGWWLIEQRQRSGGSAVFWYTPLHPYLLTADRLCAAGALELHVLCNERLDDDMQTLLRKFNRSSSNPVGLSAPLPHEQQRSSSSSGAATADSVLSPENAEWLDTVVWPADAALHRAFCASQT